MYKEFGVGLIICIIIIFILFRLKSKKPNILFQISLLILPFFILANIAYNFTNIFPAFHYLVHVGNGIHEAKRFGDAEQNLFAYSSNNFFPDQLIFPVIGERTIYLDNKNSIYNKFFEMFADSVTVSELDDKRKEYLIQHTDEFSFISTFWTPVRMDYILTPEDDAVMEALEEADRLPDLYLQLDHLQGDDSLAIFADKDNNLYITSYSYYKNMTLN